MVIFKSNGFTLIELVVVIAIMTIISVSVSVNVINFQKDAKLDAFAKVFASTLENAHNKSVSSETPEGVAGFETYDATDTLPFWNVKIESDKYSLYSKYKKLADAGFSQSNPDITLIPSGYSISPLGEVSFERLSGKTTALSYSLNIAGYSRTETVSIDNKGKVTITK